MSVLFTGNCGSVACLVCGSSFMWLVVNSVVPLFGVSKLQDQWETEYKKTRVAGLVVDVCVLSVFYRSPTSSSSSNSSSSISSSPSIPRKLSKPKVHSEPKDSAAPFFKRRPPPVRKTLKRARAPSKDAPPPNKRAKQTTLGFTVIPAAASLHESDGRGGDSEDAMTQSTEIDTHTQGRVGEPVFLAFVAVATLHT